MAQRHITLGQWEPYICDPSMKSIEVFSDGQKIGIIKNDWTFSSSGCCLNDWEMSEILEAMHFLRFKPSRLKELGYW